jgi:hypothetical protein
MTSISESDSKRQSVSELRLSEFGVSLLTVVMICIMAFPAHSQSITQIDSYPLNGPREVPDISGNPGDLAIIPNDRYIDILILGDGFLVHEEPEFLDSNSTIGAFGWYFRMFGGGPNNEEGIRPFNKFKQAFRVRALFEESVDRVSYNRTSHYKIKLEDGQIGKNSWWAGNSGADAEFRDSVFNSIADLPAPKDLSLYPSTLDNSVNGQQAVGVMASRYRRLYVVFLVKADTGFTGEFCPGGRSFPVPSPDSTEFVKVGMACGTVHEFGHTFGYVSDEYILERGTTADPLFINPSNNTRSVFNLSNISFYATGGCNSLWPLWPHLAPGGTYNPDVRSLIGNIWVGSSKGEFGSWHSEYLCEINGKSENYICDFVPEDTGSLRDEFHYCFWCEEIIGLRILERAGELERIIGGAGDINTLGRNWYTGWDNGVRADYYNYFNIDSLIASKNACYALNFAPPDTCASCKSSCKEESLPLCLPDCDIREVGNAIYVNSVIGSAGNSGSKRFPIPTLAEGVSQAGLVCPNTPLIILQPGQYAAPITITDPAIVFTDACESVLIGK